MIFFFFKQEKTSAKWMPWRTGWKKYFAYSLAVAFVFVYLKGVASLPVHSGERATEKYLMGACEREWMS